MGPSADDELDPPDSAIWTPPSARIAGSQMTRFASSARDRWGVDLRTSTELHRWSVRSPGPFWTTMWEFAGVIGDPGPTRFAPAPAFHECSFFPDGEIDVAATMLRGQPHEVVVRARTEDGAAIEIERGTQRDHVAAVAARLREAGVGRGDVVAAWATNAPGVLTTMLAAMAVGATFTSSSVEFGAAAVVARFGQVAPTVLFVTATYRYGGSRYDLDERLAEVVASLPSLRMLIVDGDHPVGETTSNVPVDRLTDIVTRPADLVTTRVGFNDPGWILYSSGTTGPPKCIVHRAGGVLLKHLSEQLLHCDISPGDRVFYHTTPGWMMWNWLMSALACGAAVVLYDGSPVAPDPHVLLRLAETERITYFGTSPGYLETLRAAGVDAAARFDLGSIRTIGVTGAPLAPRTARYAATWGDDVHVLSKSGGTDLCGGLVTGDPTAPVWPGEIQMAAVGVDIDVVDDDGRSLPVGATGELVSRSPFPSMPLGFVGDTDGSRLRATYYDRFPGCWHQADFASRTDHGGYVIHGRSDTTLNANGVRIGTAEIYAELVRVDGVRAAAAVAQEWGSNTRIVLVVVLADGCTLDDELHDTITTRLRNRCSPRHVPAEIVAADELPTTANGKISEAAVTDVLNGRPVRGAETLANPDALEHLREAFARRFPPTSPPPLTR